MIAYPRSDDMVQPFNLESLGIRGRLVRLGAVADSVIGAHDYPDLVAGLLGETLALSAALAGALNFKGVFSVQTKGDGPVSMLVVDTTSEGDMRGYASFDEKRLAEVAAAGGPGKVTPGTVSAPRLLGSGHLAFTIDQEGAADRHQAIVELSGATLAECAHNYFRRSDPLDAGIRLAAGKRPNGGWPGWRAGAIMLQHVPSGPRGAEGDGAPDPAWEDGAEENWRRALVLMGSVSDDELLDPHLSPDDILTRLFHEERVRVFRPRPLNHGCRCSVERVRRVLAALPREEVEDLKVDGKVVVTCQFCNASYGFDDADLAAIYES